MDNEELVEVEVEDVVVEEEPEQEEQPTTVEVGGVAYDVVKTGRAQARQVAQLTKWISKHGSKAARAMDVKEGETPNGIDIVMKFVEALDEDALVDLFTLIIGCPKEDTEVYFDISVLIDAVVMVYTRQPAVQKIADRFFSMSNYSGSTAGLSTP